MTDLFLSVGAPRTAVYKFVRCNPNGDQTNCVVQQTPEMPWSPELPSKLPSSTAQYLYVCTLSAAFEKRVTLLEPQNLLQHFVAKKGLNLRKI